MEVDETTTFAVVIPTFNRSARLVQALRSVLAQTSSYNFEVVVVDDGSTDDTEQVVRALDSPRVAYLRQENAGVNAARNLGASSTTAPWLVFLDDDDEVAPGWLDGLGRAIEDDRAVVSCGARHVDLATGATKVVAPRDMGPAYDGYVALFDTGSFAVRRDAFEAVGGYAVRVPSGTHKELALRLLPACTAAGWSVGFVTDPLVTVNQRPRKTRARSHPRNLFEGASYLLEHHRSRLERDPSLLAGRFGVAGVNAARLHRYARARRLFLGAIRAEPRRPVHYGRLALALVPPLADWVWREPAFELSEGEDPS